jgi:hypothetical protein
MTTKKSDAPKLEPPQQPLKVRVPREGPSPREYELLATQEQRALTDEETRELHVEQDTRMEIESAWAKYHEDRAAYERAVRNGHA